MKLSLTKTKICCALYGTSNIQDEMSNGEDTGKSGDSDFIPWRITIVYNSLNVQNGDKAF